MNSLPDENVYGHTKKLKYILNQINQYKKAHKKKINLLDFGCGNGTAVSKYLIENDINYYGVDIHVSSLQYAEKNFSTKQAKFLTEIPKGIFFDVIVYADILEHLDDPESILIEHCERLVSNGIMIGAVPNGYGPFELEKKLGRYLFLDYLLRYLSRIKHYFKSKIDNKEYKNDVITDSDEVPYNIDSGHVQFFTKKMLKDLCASSGCKIIDFQNGAFLGSPVISSRIITTKYLIKLNAKIADYLPYYVVSTWYFTINKSK